jgi:uncharacterized protein (TIGR03437 family)
MVEVEYQGQLSSRASFPIAAASPGIFELGKSQWVLNQDGTINSASNPAAAGSEVVFYATGAGQTNPAGVDGLAAVPLPAPVGKVSVAIGGANASILYAGAAPGWSPDLFKSTCASPPVYRPRLRFCSTSGEHQANRDRRSP